MKQVSQYALRQLFSPRKKFLANSRVTGALLGIILSLVPVMVVMVVVDGMIDGISDRFLSLGDSHIKVSSYASKTQKEVDEAQKELMEMDRVVSVIPSLTGKGLLINRNTKMKTGVGIKGFPADLLQLDEGYNQYLEITDGEFDLSDRRGIMVSSAAAKELDIQVGDKINMLMIVTILGNERPMQRTFIVKGLFSTGYYQLDNMTVYMNYDAAFNLFREKGFKFYLKVDDPDKRLYDLTRDIRNKMNLLGSWHVSSWQLNNKTFFANLENTRFLIMLVMVGIVFVTSFNILSTFFMIVKEKESEIAILKSCGVSDRMITRSFVTSGFILSVTGTIAGVLLGLLIAVNINGIIGFIEGTINFFIQIVDHDFSSGKAFKLMSSDYHLDSIPVHISWLKTVIIAVFSILLAFLFTLIPSLHAGKVKPIEIIRKH